MTGLLIVFVGAATLLWLSVFGYLLLLRSMAFRRRTVVPGLSSYPDIAIVVPTLNEERLILAKLADLRHIDYPRERIAVVVVDGGSADRTTALVQQEIERGEPIQLMRVEGAGKAQQINHALTHVPHEIVVVTDADSLLEPACPRELVSVLVHDPETALVGAVVRPASALL